MPAIRWPAMSIWTPVPLISRNGPPGTSSGTGVVPTMNVSLTGSAPVLIRRPSVPIELTPGIETPIVAGELGGEPWTGWPRCW